MKHREDTPPEGDRRLERQALLEAVGVLEVWEQNLPGSRVRSMIAASRVRLEWFARKEYGDRWAYPEEADYHLLARDGSAICGGRVGAQSSLAAICPDCCSLAVLFGLLDVRDHWTSDDVARALGEGE